MSDFDAKAFREDIDPVVREYTAAMDRWSAGLQSLRIGPNGERPESPAGLDELQRLEAEAHAAQDRYDAALERWGFPRPHRTR